MRITKIQIKNFRSIKDSGDVLDVTKIFALIGRNNTGKSTILKAIQLLMGERKLDITDFHKNTEEPIEISATLIKGFGTNAEELSVKIVYTKDLESKRYVNDEEVATAKFNKALPELLSINDIRNPKESTGGGRDSTLLNKILALQAESDNGARYDALSKEIQELKRTESEEVSQKISEKFRDITSENFFSISVSPTVDIEKSVSFKTALTNTNIPEAQDIDILNCGTGLQSMYILTLLEVWAEMSEKQDNTILLVEEPEVYLHPEYQRRMFAALRRIADSNQVIFTTHSPIMIADIWLTESVRQVRLNESGETQIEKVKIENVIDELGIRYEDVLNPSIVVFVEGKNDIKFFEKLGIKNPKLKIIYTDGFRAIHYFAFIKIISSEHVSNAFVILADSDGESSASRQKALEDEIYKQFQDPPTNLKGKVDGNVLVLDEYAIESYLLNADALKKAFPEIDAASLATCITEYTEKYSQKKTEVENHTLNIDEFRKYLKPKLIFETIKSPDFDTAYKAFWAEQPTFLKVKDLIAQSCATISTNGGDWFAHLLSNSDIENIPELVAKRDSILARIK
jgi:putative ATP-dependent endonuclease of the OLD family